VQGYFEDALKLVLIHEGGYVDHPRDPGGATNKGVTLAVFQRFFGADRSKEDLRAITDEQIQEVYKSGYWDKCKCDDLPAGVDYVVFDQAVNSGPGRSAKWLQAAIGTTVDGGIGPQTVAAARNAAPDATVNTMCDERLTFMQNIRGGSLWETFGLGWQRRVDGVRAHGVTLAGGDSLPEVSVPTATPTIEYESVRRGDKGQWVEHLQEALGITADGDFGPGTETSLKSFQSEHGLTPDGIAGRMTFRALGLIP
jgi:lysozyme family protein